MIQIGISPPPITGLQAQGGAVTAPATVTLCSGEAITFNATGGGAEFLFYLDDNPLGVKTGSSVLTTSTLITGNRIKVESFNVNGCSSFSQDITVQIVDNPVISLTSTAYASSASSSTFCEGESMTFTVTSTSAISTYTFFIGGIPQLVTTTNTFTPAPLLSSTTSVSVFVQTAAGCTATETLDMFLNEITSSGNIGQASATVCVGETPPAFTNIASATGFGEITYEWQSRTYGTAFGNVTASATTQVYTPTSALTTTTFFRRAAYSTYGGKQCEEYSNVIQIGISPPPITGIQVGAISAPATITTCSSEFVTFNATGGGLSFQFYIDGVPVGVRSNLSQLTTNTLIDGARVKVESWTTNAGAGGGCSSFSPEIFVIRSLAPVISLASDAYSLTSTNSIFCEGDSISFTASSTSAISTYTFSVGGVTYQSSSTNNFQPSNLTPPILMSDGAEVVVIAETPNGCTASATILMNENLVAPGLINTASPTICFGEEGPEIFNVTSATVSGAIIYEWEASIDNGSTFTPYPSSSNTYTLSNPGNLFQTTLFRRKATSNLSSLTTCSEYSNTITITVVPQVVGGTITPTNLTICSGEISPQLSVVSGTIGAGVSYNWEISYDGVIFSSISTATGQSYTPSALNTTTFYRRVTTAGSGTASTCVAESSVIRIRVIDIDAGNLDPALNMSYCYGADPPTIVSSITGGFPDDASTSVGTLTYQWEKSTNGAAWTSITSATNVSYDPPSLIETTWFRRVARATISSVSFCEDVTDPVRVEILPSLNEGFILDDQVICQIVGGADLPNDLLLNGAAVLTNSVTFQWQRSIDQLNWADIDGERSASLAFNLGDAWLPSSTEPATYYRGIITYVGDPEPQTIEQTMIELVDTGTGFSGGKTYSIVINGNRYDATSNATNTIDSVGEFFASYISATDPTVDGIYNSDSNILTIRSIIAGNYNIAASTGVPSPTVAVIIPKESPELNLRIFVSGNTGGRLPNTSMESCQVYTEVVTIEVLDPPFITQVSGDTSPQIVCVGSSIDSVTFTFGGGATSVEVRDLDPGLSISAPGGVVTNPFAGLGNWYGVGGTSTFTISGNVTGDTTFTVVTMGSSCTETSLAYSIVVEPDPEVPDFVRMNINSPGYEVLESAPGSGIWYNNTVCQDNLPAPSTPDTEFFACFENDALTRIFNNLEWDWSPGLAGSIIQNQHQETSVAILQNTSGPTLGVSYQISVTISGVSTLYSDTTEPGLQTIDQLGLRLATLADANADINAIYNDQTNQVVLEAIQKNTPFTVQVSPTGLAQSLRFQAPSTQQIVRSATMDWTPSFSGTATIRVRSVGCDNQRSGWKEIEVSVVPQAIVTPTLSPLLSPVAPNVQLCGGVFTGDLPECQIQATDEPVQFFTASDNVNSVNDFGSLEWRIDSVFPGAGSSVSSPGIIDSNLGIITWNVGWYGSFDLEVRPVTCNFGADDNDWVTRTIVIGPNDGPITSITPVGALPECPIPDAGFATSLITGGDPVRWFVNSPIGLTTNTNYIASATFFELTPTDSNSNSVELNFRPGFSGNIIISAEPVPCPGDRVNYVINVPEAPQINLTSGFNSNNITVCNGSAIDTITYEITGAANLVLANNLPAGVLPKLDITSQVTTITLITVSPTIVGRTYTLIIDNKRYSFETTAALANAADHIGAGLRDELNNKTNDFVATYAGGNLVLTPGPTGTPGNSFIIGTEAPVNSSVNIAAPVTQPLSKTFSIYGAPSIVGTGVFTYTVETQSPSAGCETAVSTGTITVDESASISFVGPVGGDPNLPGQTYCGSENFNGANALIYEFSNAAGLQINPLTPLPGGLVFGLQGGFFNRYAITGTLNSPTLTETTVGVEIQTFGGQCSEASYIVSFTLEPAPDATLTSSASLGFNRTVCTSDTMVPIRFEIANPAFTLTPSDTSEFPPGISGLSYAQKQMTRLEVRQVGPDVQTSFGDTFTVTINGTPYTAATGSADMATGTANINQLHSEFSAFLSAQLSPTYTVSSTVVPFIEIEAVNPGVGFSLSSTSSSSLGFAPPVRVNAPAYYEIAGTASVAASGTYSYILISAGAGGCTGSEVASGTITVNPNTSASYFSGVGQNPTFCDTGVSSSSIFIVTGSPVAISTVTPTTPNWITATYNPGTSEVTVNFNPPTLGVTVTTSYNYEFNLIGNNFGCTNTPSPISGTVSISPTDKITLLSGNDSQIVCVNNTPTPTFAFTTIEYELGGGANAIGTITYSQDGGPTQTGLPPGFGYSLTASNTVRIQGAADQAASNLASSTTRYEYRIETGPGTCDTAIATGTIEVRTAPTLALVSSPTTSSQIICDNTEMETIIYEFGGGAKGVNFTWTGSNTLFGKGVTAIASGTNQFRVSGTPTVNVTESTIYNYQIETVGSDCTPEIVLTGSLQINPSDSISLISPLATASQSVCYNDTDNASNTIALPIEDIIYEIGGGAIGESLTVTYSANGGPSQNGFPAGLIASTTGTQVTISGSIVASTTFTTPTIFYTYQIVTGGSCVSSTITGNFTVHSPPVLTLTSNATTTNQVGVFSVCTNSESIADITYEFYGGATDVVLEWTADTLIGVNGSITPGTNQFVISGDPSVNITSTTSYPFEVKTNGSACAPEITLTGTIQVKPTETITLASDPSTENQTVCAGSGTNTLEPIIYNFGQGANSAVVSFTPSLPGVGITSMSATQVIIGGVVPSAAQASTTILTYNYDISTTGCGPATDSGVITVLPTPVMELYAGNPNQPSVCNNDPITDIDYIFNTQSNATYSISWDVTPTGITPILVSAAGGTNNVVRIQGVPSVNVSITTTYNYQLRLSGTCDPDVVRSGSISVDPGPDIDKNYIQDFLVKDVECYNDNTGSIVLGDTSSPDFLNAIKNIRLGSVQISEIAFAGVATYTDILRVTINGTEYLGRGGEVLNGNPVGYTNAQIISNFMTDINNDPSQTDLSVSQTGFGLRLVGEVEGVSFTLSANTTDTNAITNTVTTTQAAQTYTPVVTWHFPDSSIVPANNIYNLYSGSYALNVTIGGCTSSATFFVDQPDELSFEVDFCGGVTGAITVQASGGIAPYTYTIEYDGTRLPGASGIKVTNGQANFTGLTPGRLYVVEVSDSSSCTYGLTRAVRIPTALDYDPAIVEKTDSYCVTGTIGNGSIVTTPLDGAGNQLNAFSGGSGVYTYRWVRSDTSSTVVYGVGANLYNIAPGDYYVTVTDAILGCEYPPQLITLGGYTPVRLNGVETANFINLRGANPATSSATADYQFTLNCNGGSDGAFDLFATGGSGNLDITSLSPAGLVPAGSGAAVNLSNVAAGDYIFQVTDLSPPLDPDGNAQAACTDIITVRVVEPDPLSLTLVDSYNPLCPDDIAIGGRLEFNVSGGNALALPYTINLNGGVLSASSGASSRVIFSNINISNPLQRSITSAEIVDNFGCSQQVTFTYEFPEVYTYTVDIDSKDIDCSANTSGEVTFTVNPSDVAGDLSSANPAQLYIKALSRPYEYYQTLTGNGPITITNITQADTYQFTISINNTTTCEIANDTFTIEEKNNEQLILDLDVTQPGCGNSESQISLTITNAIPPLEIKWYENQNITTSAVYSSTASGTTVQTATSTTESWVEITAQRGNAIVTGLPTGIYRAIATDGRVSSCEGNEFITRNVVISESTLSVSNFRTTENIPEVSAGTCKNYPEPSGTIDWLSTTGGYTNDIFFSISSSVRRTTAYNGFNIALIGPDGSNVDLTGNSNLFGLPTQPSLERPGYTYRFRNLPSGEYTLTITENVTGTLVPCQEIFYFTVEEFLPIQYDGETVFETDICTGAVDGGITASAIGGVPYIVDGVPTYEFEWTYTPTDPTASTQVFYGATVDPAYPGTYCLRVIDQNSHSYCSCDAAEANKVSIEVEDIVDPITTEGDLADPNNVGNLLKSLPPDCTGGGLNGKIGIRVAGGQLPRSINWYIEDPRYLNDPVTPGYRALSEYDNRTSLDDLLPGNYKVIISSQSLTGCANTTNYTYYEEIIQVSPNRELYIMNGPFVDEDLCVGQQGRLTIDIFDNNDGNLSFYYNDILIPSSDVVRLSDRSWSVAIVNAIETADFRIVNEEGCWITTEVNRGIGDPNFEYTSPNYEASSVILAREEVTFKNTSTDPYVKSEWIFGDNSTPEIVPTLVDSVITVRHTYGISGTYFATLRIYNDIECSEEITIPISVGKGYNIMVPNVFTPNKDLVNDYFRPLFSGFSNMTFTVYDFRGNVIYNEYKEEADINNIKGFSIDGWDGNFAPYSPYYIYTAKGLLLDGETEVEKSGTFILIK